MIANIEISDEVANISSMHVVILIIGANTNYNWKNSLNLEYRKIILIKNHRVSDWICFAVLISGYMTNSTVIISFMTFCTGLQEMYVVTYLMISNIRISMEFKK